MRELEIEVDKQLVFPGETLHGRVNIEGSGDSRVVLSLQGEEVHRYDYGPDFILPFLEETHELDCSSGSAPFQFVIPADAKPSYVSMDLRCGYVLKARREKALPGLLPGMRRPAIHRLNLTVGAEHTEAEDQPHWFVLEDSGVKLEVNIDQLEVYAGESVTGEFLLTGEPKPKEITIHFAAIEESLDNGRTHRKVLWKEVERIAPEETPLKGLFEFSVPLDSPDSGVWNIFRLFYGYRVGMTLADGKHVRHSLNIEVRRNYKPIEPAQFAQEIEQVP